MDKDPCGNTNCYNYAIVRKSNCIQSYPLHMGNPCHVYFPETKKEHPAAIVMEEVVTDQMIVDEE